MFSSWNYFYTYETSQAIIGKSLHFNVFFLGGGWEDLWSWASLPQGRLIASIDSYLILTSKLHDDFCVYLTSCHCCMFSCQYFYMFIIIDASALLLHAYMSKNGSNILETRKKFKSIYSPHSNIRIKLYHTAMPFWADSTKMSKALKLEAKWQYLYSFKSIQG